LEHRITAAEERPGDLDLPRLLEEYGDGLLRMCTLYLGDYALAEDAVQDTFLRAMNAWPRFPRGVQRKDLAYQHCGQCMPELSAQPVAAQAGGGRSGGADGDTGACTPG